MSGEIMNGKFSGISKSLAGIVLCCSMAGCASHEGLLVNAYHMKVPRTPVVSGGNRYVLIATVAARAIEEIINRTFLIEVSSYNPKTNRMEGAIVPVSEQVYNLCRQKLNNNTYIVVERNSGLFQQIAEDARNF